MQFKNSQQLGALDVGTQELAKEIFGDPTAVFTGGPTTMAKLDDVIRSTDNDLNNRAKVVGLRSKSAADVLARDIKPGAAQGSQAAPEPSPAGPPASPAQPPAPVAQPSPVAPQATVTMVGPDGVQVTVPANRPDMIQRMRDARGMVTLEEYQDAIRQRQFEAEQLAAQQQYQSDSGVPTLAYNGGS